jgi:hypothetical protein
MTADPSPDRLYETGRGGTGYTYTDQLADLAALPRLYETGRGGTGYTYTDQLADLAALPNDAELAAAHHHDHERTAMPVTDLHHVPTEDLLAELDARLAAADADRPPPPPPAVRVAMLVAAGWTDADAARFVANTPHHAPDPDGRW